MLNIEIWLKFYFGTYVYSDKVTSEDNTLWSVIYGRNKLQYIA